MVKSLLAPLFEPHLSMIPPVALRVAVYRLVAVLIVRAPSSELATGSMRTR